MTCKEAERLVIPYIHHQLDDDTMSNSWSILRSVPTVRKNWKFIIQWKQVFGS